MKITGIVVGLDMSLTGTGFCKLDGENVVIETIKTTPKTCDNDLARLDHIVTEVMKRIPTGVRMICVEDFFTPMGSAQMGSAIKLAMLGTHMRMSLFKAGFPFRIVSPKSLKKFLTGNGNAKKEMIIKEVYKRFDVEAKDDNQADAFVLAQIAAALIEDDGVGGRPKYHLEVVQKVIEDMPGYNLGSGAQT